MGSIRDCSKLKKILQERESVGTLRPEITSSSAVVKRPRDASYLSVINCYMLRRLQTYHCVQLNALFCCLWRNVDASCHKHFVVLSHNHHRRLLPAMCHNLRDGGRRPPATLLTTPVLVGILLIGMEKLEWCGYPVVYNFENIFIRFDMLHKRYRHTDRQTDRQTDGRTDTA